MFVSEIHEQASRVFEGFFDTHQEGHCTFSIYNTVIVAEGQIHHGSNFDLSVDRHGAILNLVHAEYAGLGRVQDG